MPVWADSKDQVWKHSCCSQDALRDALSDETITAIESDIVLSRVTGKPVMAHPPSTHSDLSFEDFLDKCVAASSIKHLKLDFKDPRVVRTCLKIAEKYELEDRCVWLNADVLPGPGVSSSQFDADQFIRDCIELMPDGVLSLGWRVDLGIGCAYEQSHVADMIDLLERHSLSQKRVVVAVNLRLVALGSDSLRRLLDDTSCDLLLWTGTGEPPIYPEQIHYAQDCLLKQQDSVAPSATALSSYNGDTRGGASISSGAYEHNNLGVVAADASHRVGLDVNVAHSWPSAAAAFVAFKLFRFFAYSLSPLTTRRRPPRKYSSCGC